MGNLIARKSKTEIKECKASEIYNPNRSLQTSSLDPGLDVVIAEDWTRTPQTEIEDYETSLEDWDIESNQVKQKKDQKRKKKNIKTKTAKTEVPDVIGKYFSAPHLHWWGGIVYHNAVIISIDENMFVRVRFTNPTHPEMVPCDNYFNGHCRYKTRCFQSHGEIIPFAKLKIIEELHHSKLAKNSPVLVKMKNELWSIGIVLSDDLDEERYLVQTDQHVKTLAFTDLLPIRSDQDFFKDSSAEVNKFEWFNKQSNYSKLCTRGEKLVKESPHENFEPAQWERHTMGIGSKLLSEMGYEMGPTLTPHGDETVSNFSVQMLPKGRSLDYCVNLRNMGNGYNDLVQLDRQLQIKAGQMLRRQNEVMVIEKEILSLWKKQYTEWSCTEVLNAQ